MSPNSRPYIQNMEIRFKRENRMDFSSGNDTHFQSIDSLNTQTLYKLFRSEAKAHNSKLSHFKSKNQTIDSQSKHESLLMRSRSREFRDSPIENISTSLGQSSRCSPAGAGRMSGEDFKEKTIS